MKEPERALLEARGLRKRFGTLEAVRGVSLSLRRGEIYGMIGPDGAGKSTTLRLLMGALLPDEGSITLEELDVLRYPDRARERVGYMPQQYGLYQDLTVEENLTFFAELQGVERNHAKSRIAELLHLVRLEPFRKRSTGALSGGMYKKLAIACSIIHAPSLLILDEPTNGVDPLSRRELWGLLFQLSRSGVSILLSTPYMDEAEQCHRAGLLFRGRVWRSGSPAEMIRSLKGRLFFLNASVPGDTVEILRRREAETAGIKTVYTFGNSVHIIAHHKKQAETIRRLCKKLLPGETLRPGEARFEDLFMDLQASREEPPGSDPDSSFDDSASARKRKSPEGRGGET